MKSSTALTLVVVILVAGALGVWLGLGLGKQGMPWHRPLTVGVVNTNRIIAENPKYIELNIALQQERADFYAQIPRDVRTMSATERKGLEQKLNKDAAERSSKFDKLYRDFMKNLQSEIKENTAQLARERGIDMVIIDTPNFPTVLYSSGDNITTDILIQIKP